MIPAACFDLYARLFSRRRLQKLNRALFHASSRGLGLLNYKDDAASGERRFLKDYLSSCPHPQPVVIDVGANEGAYTAAVVAVKKTARVFAFEPHPATFSRLSSRSSTIGGVTAINSACGKARCRMVLYDYAGSAGTGHASLHAGVIEGIHKGHSEQRVVDVIDLDTFAAEHGIPLIHLLKIDAEGHELDVLQGARNLLLAGRIRAIQFEFTQINVVARVFLKDFYDLLPRYKFYRMVRDGLIPLGPYSPLQCELFAFQNLVALPDDPDTQNDQIANIPTG
jgi:FkbM family methyltransferase